MEQNNQKFDNLSCTQLLSNFDKKEKLQQGKKLVFSGVNGRDVYNISSPFIAENKTVISGRVEERKTTANSQVMFFEEKENIWYPIDLDLKFPLEDGFMTHIGNEIIFGGVEVYSNPTLSDQNNIDYRTAFYRGSELSSLQRFTNGPDKMKDIRLTPLTDGNIGVFTRPQGGKNEAGKIGYIEIQNLDNLTVQNILNAKIIEGQFAPGEWGGVNQTHILNNGKIGIIGHIAYKDKQGVRHYHAMSFVYDPKTGISSPIEIIAKRENFPSGPSKIPELSDVIFPGGITRNKDGTATLYAGLGDAEAGVIQIPDPFTKEETQA